MNNGKHEGILLLAGGKVKSVIITADVKKRDTLDASNKFVNVVIKT